MTAINKDIELVGEILAVYPTTPSNILEELRTNLHYQTYLSTEAIIETAQLLKKGDRKDPTIFDPRKIIEEGINDVIAYKAAHKISTIIKVQVEQITLMLRYLELSDEYGFILDPEVKMLNDFISNLLLEELAKPVTEDIIKQLLIKHVPKITNENYKIVIWYINTFSIDVPEGIYMIDDTDQVALVNLLQNHLTQMIKDPDFSIDDMNKRIQAIYDCNILKTAITPMTFESLLKLDTGELVAALDNATPIINPIGIDPDEPFTGVEVLP